MLTVTRFRKHLSMRQTRRAKQSWGLRLTATVLAIWLSGLNCLVCCGPSVYASQTEPQNCATQLNDRCEDDDCCTVPTESEQAPPADSCEDECCLLSAPVTELPSPNHLKHFSSSDLPANLRYEVAEPATPYAMAPHALLPADRQKTYLRCCTFLI